MGGWGEGVISHFDGIAWSVALEHPRAFSFESVWGAASNDVSVVGSGREPDDDYAAIIMHWDGVAWTESFTCNPEGSRMAAGGWIANLADVYGSGAANVWGAGSMRSGGQLHSDPAGDRREAGSWVNAPGPGQELFEHRFWSAVFTSGPTDVWVASTGTGVAPEPGGVVPTMQHFDGYRWTDTGDPITLGIFDLGGTGAGDVWGGGLGGKRIHYDGTSWSVSQ